jgi:rsbT co-antagonist protein RsbR
MERVIQAFESHLQAYIDASVERIARSLPAYAAGSGARLREGVTRFFHVLREDIVRGTVSDYPEHVASLGALQAREGVAINELMEAIDIALDVVSADIQDLFSSDAEAQLWWERRRGELSHVAAVMMLRAFYAAREAIIVAQQDEILKLSAPVLPLHDGILVVPLVGALNEQRASSILPGLLDSITRMHADVVILDVTGLPSVDANVVNHLMQAAQTAKLLGTKVVLAGMRPRMAQEAVGQGLELRGIFAVSTLASAMKHALRLQGKAVLPL